MSGRDCLVAWIAMVALWLGVHFVQNKIKNDASIARDTGRIAVALERLANGYR